EGDVVDWRVHVGGQLLSDDQAREVENATIQKELIQDRRDLAGIDAKATQAKDTADQAKQATEDNRTYIDEQLVAAGAAVEQGREYLRQMEEHVAAGNAAVGQVGELAGQAAAAADDAVQILNQLDPLRDNVAAIHGDVVDLGREAQELVGAADEAVRQAIEKLAQADGKLQEADQKLQQQIDVLEDSQELLAKAVQILDGAVDQAAAAAQYAIQSADNAGKAAGEALSASEHNSSAIDAMEDTIEAREQTVEAFKQTQNEIDDMQNDAIAALESQAAEIAELQNRALNMAMVDREGTTHPDITIFKLVNTTAYDVEINNITPGTKIHADFYNRASGDSVTFVRTKQYVSTGTTKVLSADSSNQVVNLMWARPSVYQVPINLSSGAMSLDKGEWKDVPGLSRTAAGKVTNGQLKIRGTWSAANRGSTYGIRVLIGTSVFKSFTTRNLGPLSFFGDGESTYTVSVTNLKMNANQTLKVQMYSYASNAYQRSVKSATAVGSWIETA
ncbi:MAG: hypothetical protein L0L68_10660, partial [Corynebacterium sp.]|uniref:hypothetical protein n=1 Tax=Corynebacterium sp. TaxID=1720 RepID=UPI002649F5CB